MSYFFAVTYPRSIQLLLTCHLFQIQYRKLKTRMFYVANVITFSIFLELVWESTLLLRYKLNRFRPPHVNQFDIHALLFRGYIRFILLDKMIYRDNGNLPSGSSPMSQLSLTLFMLCTVLSLYSFNFTLRIILIYTRRYVCFYYCISG